MDTINIPTSMYMYERVNSLRRLRSIWLNCVHKTQSHQKVYVSAELKAALSWYLRLKIDFFSMTDVQVRKYFLYVVKKRPQDFTVKQSNVDDRTRVSDAVEGLIACRKYRDSLIQ